MGSPGTRYSKEFKVEAVSQVIDRGYSVREVAGRIGVSEHSLYRWVQAARKADEVSVDGKTVADLAAENAKLKSELRRAQEDRDRLSRAQSARKPRRKRVKESERGTPS